MIYLKNPIKFLLSGLLLSAVSLLLRTAAVYFSAEINSFLGSGGLGLYSLVGSVLSPAVTLASAGVNLAVSTLIAKEQGKNRGDCASGVLLSCIKYALSASLAVGCAVFILAKPIALYLLDSPDATALIKILAIGIPPISVSAATSGYFVSVRRISRNAVLQLGEQLFRIGATLITLNTVSTCGSTVCLTAVIICSVSADILSCAVSLILCRIDICRHRKKKMSAPSDIMKRITDITIPVSVSSFLRSGLTSLEHLLIPRGLKKRGSSAEAAMASYGILGGMALPIIFFPTSFLYSFTGLLIPELAEAKARNGYCQITKISEATLKYVTVFSVGAAALILGFSSPLGELIYHSTEASRFIALLAPLIPIMYLDTAVDSLLKGLGEQVWTMKINVADALISVFGVWLLVPALGLDGYVLLIFTSEIFNFSFSLYRLVKVSGIGKRFLYTATLSSVSALVPLIAYNALIQHGVTATNWLGLILQMLLVISAYITLLILFGVLKFKRPSAYFIPFKKQQRHNFLSHGIL